MRNIRIALYVCLAGLLATACQKDKIEEQLPLREYTTDIFKLNSAPFVDDNNGQKVYLQYTDMSSTLFYEDGDKIRIGSDLGGYGDFVIKYRTPSDGQSPAVTSEGWYAQGSAELTGNTFYAAYVDGFKDHSNNLTGEGPSSFAFNINSIRESNDYNKVILSGNTGSNANGTVLTLEPACAILRLNPQGAEYNYVKVGFQATRVPKKGTINASTGELSVNGVNDWLAGVTEGGAGEFLYMRRSNVSAGEDNYWYVAIPIDGEAVTSILYLEWSNGSQTIKYRTNGQVTLNRGYVYTVGTTRYSPFSVDGYTQGQFYVNGDNQRIVISAGNLQGKTYSEGLSFANEWQFAPSQMTALVSANTPANEDDREDIWFDLLGYGTSGNSADPYESSISAGTYPTGTIATTNNDWGVYNSSSPGINFGSRTVTSVNWRTLTKDEWEYLVGRTGKAGLATVTIEGVSYKGLVLLPDRNGRGRAWAYPEGVDEFNANFNSFTSNQFDEDEWSTLESNGVVFLPVTGNRTGNTINGGTSEGWYWTSTGGAGNPGNKSWALKITTGSVSAVATTRPTGCAVRLVANVGW